MLKANVLLKQNIETLLRGRRQNNKDLALWCRKSESWISKVLNNAERGIPLKYLDRIADFFGIATYQLLQPGISPLTERRVRERRLGRERRISAAQREMLDVTPRYTTSQTLTDRRPISEHGAKTALRAPKEPARTRSGQPHGRDVPPSDVAEVERIYAEEFAELEAPAGPRRKKAGRGGR